MRSIESTLYIRSNAFYQIIRRQVRKQHERLNYAFKMQETHYSRLACFHQHQDILLPAWALRSPVICNEQEKKWEEVLASLLMVGNAVGWYAIYGVLFD